MEYQYYEMMPSTTKDWREWMMLSPQERMRINGAMLVIYLARGGSMDPEYYPEEPYFEEEDYADPAAPLPTYREYKALIGYKPKFGTCPPSRPA